MLTHVSTAHVTASSEDHTVLTIDTFSSRKLLRQSMNILIDRLVTLSLEANQYHHGRTLEFTQVP